MDRRRFLIAGAVGGAGVTLTFLDPFGLDSGSLTIAPQRAPALDPLLAEAVVLLRASEFTGADGDDWPNEGTAGSVLDAEPSVTGEFAIAPMHLTPEMGAVQSVSNATNELSEGASLWSTPHAADMIPATSVSLRAWCRSTGDPTSDGTTNQAVWLRKENLAVAGQPTLDLCVTIAEGEIRFSWSEDDDALQGFDLGSGLDPFDPPPVRADLTLATGVVTVYTYEGGDPVTQVGGEWVQFGTDTFGVTTVQDDEGDLLFQVGKGVGAWGELWVDGVMVARFDANDGAPGDGTIESSTTGETWTAGDGIWLADVAEPGFALVYTSDGVASFTVPDDDDIDFGADDDATILWWGQLLGTGSVFSTVLRKFTGTPGVDWQGYLMADVAGAGGFNAAVLDGAPVSVRVSDTSDDDMHLWVLTLDRTADEIELWKDGTSLGTADASGLAELTNTADLILTHASGFGQVTRAAAVLRRKFTSTEITVDLPAALGV